MSWASPGVALCGQGFAKQKDAARAVSVTRRLLALRAVGTNVAAALRRFLLVREGRLRLRGEKVGAGLKADERVSRAGQRT